MRKHQLFWFVFYCLFAVCSCKEDELLPDFIYEMTLSTEALNVVPEGTNETIEVTSNCEWTVKSNVDWCKPTQDGGNAGKSSFQITVDRNEEIEERVAEVTVTAGSVVRTIQVVQLNPDGFEVIDLPSEVSVDGLENVLKLQVKTNMQLEVSSSDEWVMQLDDEVVSGNPPRAVPVRVLFLDNTTGVPRSTVVKINGKGLPDSYAKTFEVVQGVAPEADNNDKRIKGTWLITKAMNGTVNDLSLLGITMTFEEDGVYSEILPSGEENMGTWNVRGERLSIYYEDGRRYIYLENTSDGISGRMTPTDIHSDVLYQTQLSAYSGDDFGLSIVEQTNTKLVYMMIIKGDVDKLSESGICLGTNENPTVNDKKYVSAGGSVIVGEISGLLSGDVYHIRGYKTEGSNTTYTADMRIEMPVEDIDGNSYRMIKIGSQYWLAENLKVTKYRDGTPILYCDKNQSTEWTAAGDAKEGAYSWIFGEEPDWVWTEDNFNQGVTDKKAKNYGAFYNWHAVVDERKLAPEGWHIPSKAEFVTLLETIGASTEDFASGDMNYLNGLLAHDHYQNLTGWTGWAVSGRATDGSWKSWNTLDARETTWWSSDISEGGYPWLIYHRLGDTGDSGISWTYQGEGWTVRCIRDDMK